MKPRNLRPLLVVFFGLILAFSQASLPKSPRPRPNGAGAFPISFTHASAWFGEQAPEEKHKVLPLLVFFEGRPGWHSKTTKFHWDVNSDPATIQMSVGPTPIFIRYWSSSGKVQIQESTFSLTDSNVFLVENVDTSQPSPKALGIHDLMFGGDELAPEALLRRDAAVWAAVTGQPSARHWKSQSAQKDPQLIMWDQEGLRMLVTDDTRQQAKGCDLLRLASMKGYAPSEYRLGYCYESGHGVAQDFAVANQWYAKAAEQGHVDAQYKLAHSYRVGRGFAVDMNKAIAWYKKAGENGDAEALHNLGWIYATAQGGVPANPQEAYRWYLEAALHAEPGSQFEIARRLRDGDGTSKDLVGAYSWLLVLREQKKNFGADDWKQVSEVLAGVESQLDQESKKKAEAAATDLMGLIARHDMDRFARQQ